MWSTNPSSSGFQMTGKHKQWEVTVSKIRSEQLKYNSKILIRTKKYVFWAVKVNITTVKQNATHIYMIINTHTSIVSFYPKVSWHRISALGVMWTGLYSDRKACARTENTTRKLNVSSIAEAQDCRFKKCHISHSNASESVPQRTFRTPQMNIHPRSLF